MQDDVLALFGKRLAQVRKEKGWSQEKLALEFKGRSKAGGRAGRVVYSLYLSFCW